jgi:hypothetical protein
MASDALISMLKVDPTLSRDPLTKEILKNPDSAYRMLPLVIRSSNEYARLQRMYPGAARELRKLALEMGKAHRGQYNGQL